MTPRVGVDFLLMAHGEAERLGAMASSAGPEVLLEWRRAEAAAGTVSSAQAASGRYEVTPGGVAIVRFGGVVAKRLTFWAWLFGRHGSTERLVQAVGEAVNDPAVKRVLVVYDTPGGSLEGLAEASAAILAARQTKPIDSYADDCCASAGYWLACCGQRIYLNRTTQIGSVGAIVSVRSSIRAEQNAGVDTWVITSVPGKSQLGGGGPLERDEKAKLATYAGTIHEQFALTLSEGRGISIQLARELADGELYVGQEAVTRGLADEVTTLRELIGRLDAEPVVIPEAQLALEPVEVPEDDEECDDTEARGAAAEGGPMATATEKAPAAATATPPATTNPPAAAAGAPAPDFAAALAAALGPINERLQALDAKVDAKLDSVATGVTQLAGAGELAAIEARGRREVRITKGNERYTVPTLKAAFEAGGTEAANGYVDHLPVLGKGEGSVITGTAPLPAGATAATATGTGIGAHLECYAPDKRQAYQDAAALKAAAAKDGRKLTFADAYLEISRRAAA